MEDIRKVVGLEREPACVWQAVSAACEALYDARREAFGAQLQEENLNLCNSLANGDIPVIFNRTWKLPVVVLSSEERHFKFVNQGVLIGLHPVFREAGVQSLMAVKRASPISEKRALAVLHAVVAKAFLYVANEEEYQLGGSGRTNQQRLAEANKWRKTWLNCPEANLPPISEWDATKRPEQSKKSRRAPRSSATMDAHDKRYARLEVRIAELEGRDTRQVAQLEKQGARLEAMEEEMSQVQQWMRTWVVNVIPVLTAMYTIYGDKEGKIGGLGMEDAFYALMSKVPLLSLMVPEAKLDQSREAERLYAERQVEQQSDDQANAA